MGIVSEKLRRSARGQDCTFSIPNVCNHDPGTSVLCHAPSEVKGMGSKGHDYNAAIGCSDCHRALDEHRLPREDELFFWLRGLQRTWAIWIAEGLILLPVDPATAKKRPKKKSYLPSRPMQSRNNLRRKPKEAGDE